MNFLWINHCNGTSLVIGIIIKILVLLITYVIPLVLIVYGLHKYKKDKKKKELKKLICEFLIALILFAVGLSINKALHSTLDTKNKDNEKTKWHECYCELP